MMLIGLIWAAFAPLLLLLPVLLLQWLMRRAGWPGARGVAGRRARAWRWGTAAALVAVAVAGLWLPDRLAFAGRCDAMGGARILERRPVAGFFLDDDTANSFGMRYLQQEGFDWIEARSLTRTGGFIRYENTPQGVRGREVDALAAEVEVVRLELPRSSGVSGQQLLIRDRATGRELAHAGSMYFDGGRARWVLGAWGTASCPDSLRDRGDRSFAAFYYLARDTLGRRRVPGRQLRRRRTAR